jgi:hypothetical protein
VQRRQKNGCAINTNDPTDNKRAGGDKRGPSLFAIVVGLLIASIINPNDSEPGKKNTAQQKKSAFCDPIVWATIGIFVATAVSVGVGIAQWSALRSTDEATRLIAAAAKQSAEVADLTVKQMEATAERQLRAYVFVIETKILAFEVGKIIDIELTVKNTGQTPAYDLTTTSIPQINSYPTPIGLPELNWNGEMSNVNMGPNTIIYPRSITKEVLSQEWLDAIKGGNSAYYLVGEIKYFDAFKRDRSTQFRLMLTRRAIERGTKSLEISPDGNKAN